MEVAYAIVLFACATLISAPWCQEEGVKAQQPHRRACASFVHTQCSSHMLLSAPRWRHAWPGSQVRRCVQNLCAVELGMTTHACFHLKQHPCLCVTKLGMSHVHAFEQCLTSLRQEGLAVQQPHQGLHCIMMQVTVAPGMFRICIPACVASTASARHRTSHARHAMLGICMYLQ
eukprot:1160774-Pelagomonas_calceolata.AAC.2